MRKAAKCLNVVLDLEVNDPTDPVGRQWLVAIGPGRAMSKVSAAMGVHELTHWVNPQPHEWSLAEILPALSEPEDATARVEAGPAKPAPPDTGAMAEVTDDERGPHTPGGSAIAAEESAATQSTESETYDYAILMVYLSSQGIDRVELADDFGSYHGEYIWDDESILAFAVVTAVVHALADPSGSAKSVAFAVDDYLQALADPLVRVPLSYEVREYLERTAPLEVAWIGRVSTVEREEERGDHRLDWVTAGERSVPPPRVLAETLLQHWARTAARDSADHAALIAALEAARLWTTAAEQDRAEWSDATRTAIAVSLWRLARNDRPEPTKPAAWLEPYEDQGVAEDEQL